MLSFLNKDKRVNKEFRALQEELEDFKFYFDEFSTSLPLPFLTINPLGVILDVNKAFEGLVGRSKVDILGQDITDFFIERGKIILFQKRVLSGEEIKVEELTITSSSGNVPVSVYFKQRRDRENNIIGYFVAIFNITSFKELQESLENKVRERTKELTEKVDELERFYKLTVGRELKMIKLKEEVKGLQNEVIKNN